jgi:branched-chain amino acid transport system permease protein
VVGSLTVMLLSMVVCMALAVTIERVAYKPLRDAPRIAALITAIGVSFFLEFFGALSFVFSPRFIPYERPFEVVTWYIKDGVHLVTPMQAPPEGSVTFSNIFLLIVLASVLTQVFLQFLVRRTKIGKAMRAASFDKPAARLMGINVDRVISFTFAVGAAFAGLGGVLYAIAYSSIWSQLGILPGLKAFVAAVLGGIGSIPGAPCGRPDHGAGRGAHHGIHLHPHAGRRGVHHPDSRAAGSADGHIRRTRERKGLGHRG